MYYKIHQGEGKLDQRWETYYRIVEQTGLMSYIIWHKVAGRTKRAHANDLKLAEMANWEMSEEKGQEKQLL